MNLNVFLEEVEVDHEVSMAKSDLKNTEKNLKELMKILDGMSDEDQLEGWVQSKITKFNDYLESVTNHLRNK